MGTSLFQVIGKSITYISFSFIFFSAATYAKLERPIHLPLASDGHMAVLAGIEPILVVGGMLHGSAEPHLTLVDTNAARVVGNYKLPAAFYQGFNVANLAGQPAAEPRSQLVLLGRDGLYQFEDGSITKLIECNHVYARIDSNNFSVLPVVFDVNEDGLSDFLIPGFLQHCLAVQQTDGSFHNQTLDFALDMQIQPQEFDSTELKFALPADIKIFDVNGDKHSDIVIAGKTRIDTFLQKSDGSYHSKSTPLLLPLTLSEQRGTQLTASITYQFHRFEDLNLDGLPDLLLFEKQYGKTTTESSNGIRVLYAKRDKEQALGFSATQGFIKKPGEMVTILFADFNGDKLRDATLLSGELGAGSFMSVVMGGGVDMDISIYPQQASGLYADKPVVKRETEFKLDIHNLNYGVFISAGNFNGDSFDDLLYVNHKNKLELVSGSSKGWLKGKSIKVAADLPADPNLLNVLDLNQDGILELLIRTPQPKGGHDFRVVSFLSDRESE